MSLTKQPLGARALQTLQQSVRVGQGRRDAREGELWRDLENSVGEVRGGVQAALGLAVEYGLCMRRETACSDGAEKVISDFRCETLEVSEKLGWFSFAHFLVQEEFFSRAVRVRWTTGASALL